MKTSLSIDRKSPNPGAVQVRAGFIKALETMITFIKKAYIPDIAPHRFREDRLLWEFFVPSRDYPLIQGFNREMRSKSCDRIAFHLSHHEKHWDLRVNVKKGKKTTASITMHFHAETGLLVAISNSIPA